MQSRDQRNTVFQGIGKASRELHLEFQRLSHGECKATTNMEVGCNYEIEARFPKLAESQFLTMKQMMEESVQTALMTKTDTKTLDINYTSGFRSQQGDDQTKQPVFILKRHLFSSKVPVGTNHRNVKLCLSQELIIRDTDALLEQETIVQQRVKQRTRYMYKDKENVTWAYDLTKVVTSTDDAKSETTFELELELLTPHAFRVITWISKVYWLTRVLWTACKPAALPPLPFLFKLPVASLPSSSFNANPFAWNKSSSSSSSSSS